MSMVGAGIGGRARLISDRAELRDRIIEALELQGYAIRAGRIELPQHSDKDVYREVQQLAVAKKRELAARGLARHEETLLGFIANGWEVSAEAVSPRVVLVGPDTEEELLFRYAAAHWSIPVSSGYGRRLRFLVVDESNGKLMGLFGLHDPVYSIGVRDRWIGWDPETKKRRLYHVMDAYVLGAVPPYSYLLGGKLVALLALSHEVRAAFRRKYGGTRSLIMHETRPPYLVMLTTASALGRSSVYNRIRFAGHSYWTSLGFTQGSGEFHFSNGVYESMRAFVERNCEPTAKHPVWGTGFRSKREVVRKCLAKIGLPADLIYHGIRREIFAAALGREALRFLRGEADDPEFYGWSAQELVQVFKERWLLPRSRRGAEHMGFNREQYRLWR